MKELSPSKKALVVRLFFDGYPFDEIARLAGIAKGSLVNIVDQLRNGSLQPWPETSECIEALRQLAIYLKKQGLNLAQAGSYFKIHNKLKGLGEESTEACEISRNCS